MMIISHKKKKIRKCDALCTQVFFEALLFAIDLFVFVRVPLLEQDVPGIVPEPRAVFPTDPGAPRLVDPGLV